MAKTPLVAGQGVLLSSLLHPPLPFPLPALSSLLEKVRELEGDKVTAADTNTGLSQEFWLTGIQEIDPRATLWPPHLGELLIL